MSKVIKKVILSIIIGSILIQSNVYANALQVSESKTEDVNNGFDKINKIEFSQSFKLGEKEYIVYYYMDGCRFCSMIEDDLLNYAAKLNYMGVYAVQMDLDKNISGWCDMNKHHEKYDIEIGSLDEEGNINYYNGESYEKYANREDLEFDIIVTDESSYESYKEINKNAEPNKVYAVDYNPRINTSEKEKYRVFEAPTAIWVKDGKIVKNAIGPDQVLELFESYCKDKSNMDYM